jgi:hypothetical protein
VPSTAIVLRSDFMQSTPRGRAGLPASGDIIVPAADDPHAGVVIREHGLPDLR